MPVALVAALLGVASADSAGAQADTASPRVTAGPAITSSPASGDTYAAGEAIEVSLTFSEAVAVSGEPRLRLTVGERGRWARYSGGSGTAALTFAYTVKRADVDDDGVSIKKNRLELRGGTIADVDDNAARRKHPALPDQAGHKVNGSPTPPTEPVPEPDPAQSSEPEPAPEPEPARITAGPVIISSPAGGDTYAKGEAIVVAVTFSEAVTVDGQPRMRLAVGGRDRWARYDHSRQDATVLVFAYKVKGSDLDDNGVSIGADQLTLRGGSIADAADNAADLEHPALADQAGHKVDGDRRRAPVEHQQPPANRAPQFASATDTRSVMENATAGTAVGDAVTATDADNDTLTYGVSGSYSVEFFTIDTSGQISVAPRVWLDHEALPRHIVTVTVSDGKNAAGEADASVDDSIRVTVNILNNDEPGRIHFSSRAPAVGRQIRVSLSDPDRSVSEAAWTWHTSWTKASWESVGSGDTYTPAADDLGKYLRATVSYKDGSGSQAKTLRETLPRVGSLQPNAAEPVRDITDPSKAEVRFVSGNPPREGVTTLASLSVRAGIRVVQESWKWALSSSQDGPFTEIAGATSAAYTPVAGDKEKYLQATVTYEDITHGITTRVRSKAAKIGSHPAGR